MKKILLFVSTAFFIATAATNASANIKFEIAPTYLVNDYKKVDSSELTPAVVEQILKEYPTSKLAGVYKNEKGQFKLIMVLQSGTRRTVYIDQFGRWFKPKR